MCLAFAFILLPSLVSSQFFQQQPVQNQNIQRNGQSSNLHPYQYPNTIGQQNSAYGQRSNTAQNNAGGIMRQNSAHVPNSQTNQHPIFNLMQGNQNQQRLQQQAQQQRANNLFNPNQGQHSLNQNSQSHRMEAANSNSNSNQQHISQPAAFQSSQNQQNQQNPQSSAYQSPLNQQTHQSNTFQSGINQQNTQNQQNSLQSNRQQPQTFNRLSNRANQWTGSSGVNSPGILTTPNRGAVLNPGASFYIQLTAYTNERLAMKDGKTCYCPREECTLLENILHPCYFSFTVVVASASGEPVHYISKQFVQVNSTGIPSPSDGDWTVPVTLSMASKPTYIDIFVNNLGPVISGRQVNYLDEFWQVDTFTIDLNDYTPSIANQQPTPVNARLTGQLTSTNLEVSYYVQCQAGLLGENCDLQCKPAKQQDPPRTICTSRITNASSVCGLDSNRQQVQNCQVCGNGVVNDQCADLAAFEGRELGVSNAFRVWTIVLGILLGIAIIFILILIIMYVLAERKLKQDQQPEVRTNGRRYNGGGHVNGNIGAYENGRHAISNPLLPTDDWSKPAHQPNAFIHQGVESESNHSDAAPRPGLPSTSAFQPHQPRREAQV